MHVPGEERQPGAAEAPDADAGRPAETGGGLPGNKKPAQARCLGGLFVEMAGIEPASDEVLPGLLRAQSAVGFLCPVSRLADERLVSLGTVA